MSRTTWSDPVSASFAEFLAQSETLADLFDFVAVFTSFK